MRCALRARLRGTLPGTFCDTWDSETMVQNNKESRRKYRATRSSVCLFACIAHSFVCSTALFGCSLTPKLVGKWMIIWLFFFALDHSEMVSWRRIFFSPFASFSHLYLFNSGVAELFLLIIRKSDRRWRKVLSGSYMNECAKGTRWAVERIRW